MKFFLFLLYPFSLLYQVIFYFSQKRKKPIALPVDLTISIGNLSVGGTGKTPFTIHITKLLNNLNSNILVTILSRGYGSKLTKIGARVELDSNVASVGDEPFMIKSQLSQAELIIGSNRIQSFYKHSNQLKDNQKRMNYNKVILLDDGFQHISIQRDIDIVLVDGFRPIENGFTLPLGKLRETENALSRAHILILTRCRIEKGKLLYNQDWQTKIHKKFPSLKIFHAIEKKLGYINRKDWLKQSNPQIEFLYGNGFLRGKKALAFCGLGSPNAFFQSILEEDPIQLECRKFRDHFDYPDSSLKQILSYLDQFDILICTEKDYVKIFDRLDEESAKRIFFLRIETSIYESDDWIQYWKSVLDSRSLR